MSDLTQSLSVERRWIVTGTPTTHLLGLKLGSAGQDPVIEQEENADMPRRWTAADVEDLRKLGGMLGRILQVPIFSDHSKAFENLVRAPLRTPGGPQPGSIQVLEQVMQMAMIRHRLVFRNPLQVPSVTENYSGSRTSRRRSSCSLSITSTYFSI
jgi:hypothetical protein